MDNENRSIIGDEKDDDIDQRRPKPYRYITDDKEITFERVEDDKIPCSVMANEESMSADMLAQTFETTLGIGDMETVEHVLKKHEKLRSEMKQ